MLYKLALYTLVFSLIGSFHLSSLKAQSNDPKPLIRIQSGKGPKALSNQGVLFWEDQSQMRSMDFVSRAETQAKFKPLSADKQFKPFQVYWLKFELRNELGIDNDWILSLGKLTDVEVYISKGSSHFDRQQTGQFVPTSEKDIKTGRFNHVNIFLPARSQKTVYVRFINQVAYNPDPNLRLALKSDWQERIIKENLVQGFFHGLLGMMFLYNLLLFIRVGDRAYFFYLAYILTTSLYMLNFYGYWGEFFMGDYPVINYLYIPFTGYLSFIFYLQLMRDYLHTPRKMPFWDNWLKFLMALFIISMVSMLVLATADYQAYMQIEKYVNSSIFIILLIINLIILFTGNLVARYFALGTIFMCAGGVILLLGSAGLLRIPYNELYYQLGIVLEVCVFSLGLSERYRLSEQERLKARKALIAQLQKTKEVQEKANRELEAKVKARTAKIEKQKEEILVQSEEIMAQRDLLESQKVDLEDKNVHITDSIIYASRIQQAILDDYQELEGKFSGAFIMYRPKDIVSGDFYWFAEVNSLPSLDSRQAKTGSIADHSSDMPQSNIYPRDGETVLIDQGAQKLKVVIAADCTGHGVPGAFMTVMGNALLNEIIHEKQIVDPGEILNHLDQKVISTLKKQGSKKQLYDGMDIGLLCYDPNLKKMHFAGATNPLYRVRNGEIEVIKASKYSIGYSSYYKDKVFETHTMQAQEGDIFYLSSDGFQDQFGGVKGRKFMKKRFRELLLQISYLPMQEQKLALEYELDHWRGEQSQTDDVIVLGLKI